MRCIITFLISLLFNSAMAYAQVDSAIIKADSSSKDSSQIKKDSVLVKDTTALFNDSALINDLLQRRFISDSIQKKKAIIQLIQIGKQGSDKKFTGKDFLFYYLLLLLLILGLLREAFAKYFSDLFRVFFRTTLKQRQVREQLLQTPLPSAFMNIFFVLTAGLYINFLLEYFHLSVTENFWLQYFYCSVSLAIIYLIKFLGLEISGWLFNVSEATDAYIFIVFIINKMMGILLLPFLILLAFTKDTMLQASLALSWVGVGLLLGYRLILSYSAARNEVKLNPFHFILYVVAFELVPLLLIYKLLLMIF